MSVARTLRLKVAIGYPIDTLGAAPKGLLSALLPRPPTMERSLRSRAVLVGTKETYR